MKDYKPLVSSAPAHSILNARTFHYTSSVATDIRKTFDRVLHNRTKAGVMANGASNVRHYHPTAEGRLAGADDKLYAHATTTCRIFERAVS